ncbi:MAG TPA: YiiX/YebB-like N1pC/P60 family cysteine hydrolase [Burkholderiaceae bacterium]|nr:YiiX/YebB-like N1pC/P60 family cysteine hydrolase [Burkholderiaceae bacterium]
MFQSVGRALAQYLSKPIGKPGGSSMDARLVADTLAPGDVLLVEGNTRMSAAIKYLTQSMWSHASLFVGIRPELPSTGGEPATLVEADVLDGVRAVPLSSYGRFRVRICRPVKLTAEDRERVIQFAIQRLGHQYDLQNVLDLARYLFPIPVPARLRRRLIAFGSGDPSRAICSTLIAQAFNAVRYPILPVISRKRDAEPEHDDQARELWRIRHYSLYVPRDFDASPFFEVVKPRIAKAFDYRHAPWSEGGTVVMGDSPPTEHWTVVSKNDTRA